MEDQEYEQEKERYETDILSGGKRVWRARLIGEAS